MRFIKNNVALAFLVASCTVATVVTAQQQPRPLTNDDSAAHGGMPMDDQKPSGVDRATELELSATVERITNGVPAILTHSYNNLRTGANLTEKALTPNMVKNGLRELFTITLGGDKRGLESQPLLVPNVATVDGQNHDLLVLSTMANLVAVFDAHDGTPIWSVRLANPITGTRQIDMWGINDHWGILSTGVVADGVLYVVAWTSPDGSQNQGSHWLYALSLTDGRQAKPRIQLTKPSAMQRKQRGALTYATIGGKATIFIPWGTVQETANGAHGFITAIDVGTWKIATELNMSPTGKGGGVWMAGQGLLVDGDGFLYAMVSNGDYDGVRNFSESFVKLRYTGTALTVIDHFSPYQDKNRLQANGFDDMDLGSGGPALIPELGLLFGAGKDGILWTMPWRNLKASPIAPIWFTFYPGDGIPAKPTDILFNKVSHHAHSSPIVWKLNDQWRVYNWGENENLRAWEMKATGPVYLAKGAEVSSVQSPVPPGGMPGGFLTLSANGSANGIVWATVPLDDANRRVQPGYLIAYDAATFGKFDNGETRIMPLWKSGTYSYNKFNPPVVSGGKVYLPTYDGKLIVYGL